MINRIFSNKSCNATLSSLILVTSTAYVIDVFVNGVIVTTLAAAAMNVLVSFFYLVVGPVGVAVNVLCEGGGEDVTQKCRKSTFRMLGALQRVKPTFTHGGGAGAGENVATPGSGLGKGYIIECLVKLKGFCKAEGMVAATAGGLAAMRRKSVLKDIFDATVRAINAMGGAGST